MYVSNGKFKWNNGKSISGCSFAIVIYNIRADDCVSRVHNNNNTKHKVQRQNKIKTKQAKKKIIDKI